jgi:hypothetical protein
MYVRSADAPALKCFDSAAGKQAKPGPGTCESGSSTIYPSKINSSQTIQVDFASIHSS